jgi:hypothetical protein
MTTTFSGLGRKGRSRLGAAAFVGSIYVLLYSRMEFATMEPARRDPSRLGAGVQSDQVDPAGDEGAGELMGTARPGLVSNLASHVQGSPDQVRLLPQQPSDHRQSAHSGTEVRCDRMVRTGSLMGQEAETERIAALETKASLADYAHPVL